MENEKRLYEFQKLTPYEKADMEWYDQSLNFVFQKENEDLRNIAITGNFGSGKSSVIRSYAEKHKDLSFIYVSLAHFEGVSGETDKENYDVNAEGSRRRMEAQEELAKLENELKQALLEAGNRR